MLPPETSALEEWLRDYYFTASIDISSSGIEPYTFGELAALLGFSTHDLSPLSFRDSRSAGADELRALIARRAAVDSNSVLATNGSTEAQLLTLAATLRAGDEVIVLEPAYHSLISTVRAMGCHVLSWRLRPDQQFQPNLDDLRELVSRQTKMIIVNFPHNPTGITLSREQQLELVRIAERHGSYLLWDGAFEDITYDGPVLPPVSAEYEKGLSFGTLSKAFGLPGLRAGWGIVPPYVVDDAVRIRDYTTLALSPLVELIAIRVLQQPETVLESRLAMARENKQIVAAWLEDEPRLSCAMPTAGVLVFPQLLDVKDTADFCRRMMHSHGVLLVPGECFGYAGYVRLGFGGSTSDLRQGLAAVSSELRNLDGGDAR